MKILITICARGGSKGIPDKNIKMLAGKRLINYTIELAIEFKTEFKTVDIALSSDSMKIIDIARKTGLEVTYTRPEILATDNAGKIDSINDVLRYYEKENKTRYDYILDLDVTSPLRNMIDLKAAFEIIQSDLNATNLFSVSPANRNPYFNMVENKSGEYFGLVKQINENVLTRQAAPKVYDLNASFYFYRRSFFDLGYESVITDKSLIYEIPHICFDLDHQIDFDVISYLTENNKLDFKL